MLDAYQTDSISYHQNSLVYWDALQSFAFRFVEYLVERQSGDDSAPLGNIKLFE